MMSFFYAVTDHLKGAGLLYAPLKFDLLDTSTESISFNFIPVPPAKKMFKGEIRNVQFQMKTKSKNQVKACDALGEIRDALDLSDEDLHASDFKLIVCECYVEPNWVEKTSASEFIYTALFRAELEMI
ncbi:minor capsid protein [Lysinibacillus sp. RS5]|uniref:phage tail terminator protein n=1 Tax=unclassified Lysinibacillus TaxID=2636778 RepID=UPI0035BE2E1F